MRNGWEPQAGPQTDLCDCPYDEVFFGGARGGGKTDGVLGKWAIKEQKYGQSFNGIMFRRTSVSAEDAVERSKEIYGPLGGKFNEQKLRWRMPHGGRVSFAYLENTQDANEYQGRNVTDAWVEEAGQYPPPPKDGDLSPPIARLFGVLRSAHAVPIQLILTANPGGAGQNWIRSRYKLHPFPRRGKVLRTKLPSGDVHEFAVIPSRITDNKLLIERDPGYIPRMQLVGSPQLVKAWLEGDWSAIEGAFFSEWSDEKHVLAPFAIPDTWLRFRSGDWGSLSPFSIGWWAVVGDDYHVGEAARKAVGEERLAGRGEKILPRGAMVRYREWYGEHGGKLTAEQVGAGIVERERDDRGKLAYGVMDPRTFAEDGGPSIMERLNNELIRAKMAPFHKADNKRVPRHVGDPAMSGPIGGWDQMRARIVGKNGVPMIYCFSTCSDSIRTIPVLQHDESRAEDVNTKSEDHCADEWRYACMSRSWVKTIIAPERPKDGYRPATEEVDAADFQSSSSKPDDALVALGRKINRMAKHGRVDFFVIEQDGEPAYGVIFQTGPKRATIKLRHRPTEANIDDIVQGLDAWAGRRDDMAILYSTEVPEVPGSEWA